MTDTKDMSKEGRSQEDIDTNASETTTLEDAMFASSDNAMGDLLRRALQDPPSPGHHFLPGVQRKIRVRTKGRYFRDRWSTSTNPVSLILMCTLLLVILSAALFLVIQPLVDAPVPTDLKSPPMDPMGIEEANEED